jgi:enoyl-CoA hydratase
LNQHRFWNRVFNEIENLPKLTIAALNGPAIGGAMELALACDLRYAAENATFRLPQINFGILPDAGATARLPRIIGAARAKEFMFSGDSIDADEAAQLGLVNRVFLPYRFAEEVRTLAHKMAGKPPLAFSIGKQQINDAVQNGDRFGALQASMDSQSFLIATEDFREGLSAFRERRKPGRYGPFWVPSRGAAV